MAGWNEGVELTHTLVPNTCKPQAEGHLTLQPVPGGSLNVF